MEQSDDKHKNSVTGNSFKQKTQRRIGGSHIESQYWRKDVVDVLLESTIVPVWPVLGIGMFITDPTFFHPGSRIRIFSIPDPGSTSKNLSILTPKKWFLSSMNYDPGCSSRIRIPDTDPDFLPIPDPGYRGSKRHRIPDPQHCIQVSK
jgi:hypothetical protein